MIQKNVKRTKMDEEQKRARKLATRMWGTRNLPVAKKIFENTLLEFRLWKVKKEIGKS
jgi:hypothetical protein